MKTVRPVETVETGVRGIILQSKDVGHSNRLCSIFTEQHGVIFAFANGTKNPKSKLSGITQPLVYGRYVISERNGTYTIQSGEVVHVFVGIQKNIDRFFLALYFCQLTQALAPKEENTGEALRLFLNTLYLLEEEIGEPELLKPIYELRLLSLSGYMPDLVACAECGKFEDTAMRFYLLEGTIRCGDCIVKGKFSRSMPISLAVLRAMRHIIYAEMENIFRFTLKKTSRKQLVAVVENYLLEQMGSSFNALEFYRSMKPTASS